MRHSCKVLGLLGSLGCEKCWWDTFLGFQCSFLMHLLLLWASPTTDQNQQCVCLSLDTLWLPLVCGSKLQPQHLMNLKCVLMFFCLWNENIKQKLTMGMHIKHICSLEAGGSNLSSICWGLFSAADFIHIWCFVAVGLRVLRRAP